jgi:hypothetical protein
MPTADAMLFDFSDSEWHFGLEPAIAMANTYPHTTLLLHHWGCVDAPDFPPFNADPAALSGRVDNPDRIKVVAWRAGCIAWRPGAGVLRQRVAAQHRSPGRVVAGPTAGFAVQC